MEDKIMSAKNAMAHVRNDSRIVGKAVREIIRIGLEMAEEYYDLDVYEIELNRKESGLYATVGSLYISDRLLVSDQEISSMIHSGSFRDSLKKRLSKEGFEVDPKSETESRMMVTVSFES